MSVFKMCRLWCDHSREMTEEDDSDEHGPGSVMLCSDCGCPLALQEGYWDPKPGREEECDCPDCRRDFWRYRPPTLPLQMPWRHDGERLRMWERNAKSWLTDFTVMWGATHHRFTPADSACESAFWNVDMVEVELSEFETKAKGAA